MVEPTPIWKICSLKWESFPRFELKKNIWNHHPDHCQKKSCSYFYLYGWDVYASFISIVVLCCSYYSDFYYYIIVLTRILTIILITIDYSSSVPSSLFLVFFFCSFFLFFLLLLLLLLLLLILLLLRHHQELTVKHIAAGNMCMEFAKFTAHFWIEMVRQKILGCEPLPCPTSCST